jgi:hypothetical protein
MNIDMTLNVILLVEFDIRIFFKLYEVSNSVRFIVV